MFNLKWKLTGITKTNSFGIEVSEIKIVEPSILHDGVKSHFSEVVQKILISENFENILKEQNIDEKWEIFTNHCNSTSIEMDSKRLKEDVVFLLKSDLIPLLLKNEAILIKNGFEQV